MRAHWRDSSVGYWADLCYMTALVSCTTVWPQHELSTDPESFDAEGADWQ